jgi:hypothetical protein
MWTAWLPLSCGPPPKHGLPAAGRWGKLAKMTPNPDIAIVLTSAIIVSTGSGAVEEAAIRRQQYLAALRFYARFAPVYFLENSGYDLLGDAEFTAIAGAHLRAVPAQENEGRGKGYREFHALDLWHAAEQNPPARILKITGRYLFANIADLLAECRAEAPDILIFDRNRRDGIAVTSLFSLSWADYETYLRGLYRQVKDPQGIWIEHLVYRELTASRAKCRFFRREPDVGGISGSSGQEMRTGRAKFALKQALRTVNGLFDDKFLYLRGTSFGGIKKKFAER